MEMERLQELLNEKRYLELKSELAHLQEVDIAEFIDELEDDRHVLIVFRLLQKEIATEVFAYLSGEKQTIICDLIGDEELKEIVSELFFDDMIDLLEEVPAYLVKRIMKQRGEKERRLINQFLKYKENTAGGLMTIEFVDLHRNMSVDEAMMRIRRDAEDKETIYTCYVIDDKRRLDGIVSLKDLVMANRGDIIEDIMEDDFIFVTTEEDQEEVADLFHRYDLLSVPVVDSEKRLVGIITVDDIMDVLEEENTEDILVMSAVTPSTESYMDQGVWDLAKKRFPWLLIMMISAILSGMIISAFEATLATCVALTVFMPMLMGTGGNAGSQSSTTIIRALTLGEVEFRDIAKVVFKEVRVSLLVGVMLAIVNFARVVLLEGYPIEIGLVVCVTLVFTVVVAKCLGGFLPIVAKKLGFDPALMASPLITTIVDSISLLIYFAIASVVLGI